MWLLHKAATRAPHVMVILSAGSVVSCSNAPVDPVPVVGDSITSGIQFHYEDSFSSAEKEKLEAWIITVSTSAAKVLGDYPFEQTYVFHRENGADRAVVFGHTKRTETYHSAHFYVDPAYPCDDFLADWIGPHEISHLALPKLRKSDAWFYEGFATYISRKIMVDMGTVTAAAADSTIRSRIAGMKWAYESSSDFITVADSLVAHHHRYPEMYWGGASYWHRAELALEEQEKVPLSAVLRYFQHCCHEPDLTLEETIARFDAITQSTVFSTLLHEYRHVAAREILNSY